MKLLPSIDDHLYGAWSLNCGPISRHGWEDVRRAEVERIAASLVAACRNARIAKHKRENPPQIVPVSPGFAENYRAMLAKGEKRLHPVPNVKKRR